MNSEQRNEIIHRFNHLELSDTAKYLLDALIRTWEESSESDDGLREDLNSLAEDWFFARYLERHRRGKRTKGVDLVHALQNESLVSRLSMKYRVLGSIHVDLD